MNLEPEEMTEKIEGVPNYFLKISRKNYTIQIDYDTTRYKQKICIFCYKSEGISKVLQYSLSTIVFFGSSDKKKSKLTQEAFDSIIGNHKNEIRGILKCATLLSETKSHQINYLKWE